MEARKGSDHGYDVTDPTRLRDEVGGMAGFERLARELRRRDMGMVLDIVPNHMAASMENPWWRSVLEHGRASPFASFFDIDWDPPEAELRGRVLVPVLSTEYRQALARGELRLIVDGDGLGVECGGRRLPLAARSCHSVLETAAAALRRRHGDGYALARRLARLASDCLSLDGLPGARRRREVGDEVRESVARLWRAGASGRRALEGALRKLNAGGPVDLDPILGKQHYLLAHWKRAATAINYRRFFNVSDLVCLRIHDPAVFAATHDLAIRIAKETSGGLRIDHVDGLLDPAGYLAALRRRLGKSAYVVVEKITIGEERLPPGWPVAGTTGYDFLNLVNGLFVDTPGWRRLVRITSRFTRKPSSFAEVSREARRFVMRTVFVAEMRTLAHQARSLVAGGTARHDLRDALIEMMASLPVYRTYVRDKIPASGYRRAVDSALRAAEAGNPDPGRGAYAALRRILLLTGKASPRDRRDRLAFIRRWQEMTGPIMAKGVEDTAFYRHYPLLSLNEVGGDPGAGGLTPAVFHDILAARGRRWPGSMNTTATHDTKRGEDARSRINVLSQVPGEWEKRLAKWRGLNRSLKRTVGGRPVPGPGMEIFIYQTLLGAWPLDPEEHPLFIERLSEYLIKAAREAREHTSWLSPDGRYEKALLGFIDRILRDTPRNRFLLDFLGFQRFVGRVGALEAMSRLLVKVTAPGVPDFFQGTELWDFSFVDPDNRRPVDLGRRARMLERLRNEMSDDAESLTADLLSCWTDGRIKMYLTWRALGFRREHPALFLEGEYRPITASAANRLCAFARVHRGAWALVAVPRLAASHVLPDRPMVSRKAWGRGVLHLPARAPAVWTEILTGRTLTAGGGDGRRTLSLAHVLSDFPVALLAGGRGMTGTGTRTRE